MLLSLSALLLVFPGTHYVTSTLELGPEDSYISFVNYPGEVAAISGAKPLKTIWAPIAADGSDGELDSAATGSVYGANVGAQLTGESER